MLGVTLQWTLSITSLGGGVQILLVAFYAIETGAMRQPEEPLNLYADFASDQKCIKFAADLPDSQRE